MFHSCTTKSIDMFYKSMDFFHSNLYLFKVNNRNTRKSCEICSKLILLLTFTPFSSVSIVDSVDSVYILRLYRWISRSSHRRWSVKKGVLTNFAKLTGKHLCQRPATLLKKRLWHRCFPVNFAKFLRTPFLRNTSGLLLPNFKKLPIIKRIKKLFNSFMVQNGSRAIATEENCSQS